MSVLATRIRERLEFLRMTPRRASLQAGLSPAAVGKMLNGTSESPRYSSLEALSTVLQCSPGYLVGTTDDPETDDTPMPNTLLLVGEIRRGTWQDITRIGEGGGVLIAAPIPDEDAAQFGVVVADRHLDDLAPPGSALHLVRDETRRLKAGDIVVAMRSKYDGALIEMSAWEVLTAGALVQLTTRTRTAARRENASFKPRDDDHMVGTDEHGEMFSVMGRAVRVYIPLGGSALFEVDPRDNSDDIAEHIKKYAPPA